MPRNPTCLGDKMRVGHILNNAAQTIVRREDGHRINRLSFGALVAGGADQGGGAEAFADAEDFPRLVRVVLPDPPHGAEHIAAFDIAEAGELPAAFTVAAEIKCQHIKAIGRQIADEPKLRRLIGAEAVAEDYRPLTPRG